MWTSCGESGRESRYRARAPGRGDGQSSGRLLWHGPGSGRRPVSSRRPRDRRRAACPKGRSGVVSQPPRRPVLRVAPTALPNIRRFADGVAAPSACPRWPRAVSSSPGMSDATALARQRAAWEARPELRAVYRGVVRLAPRRGGRATTRGRDRLGPRILQGCAPPLVATDVRRGTGCGHPLRRRHPALPPGSVGAIVMVDALHHLPHPLDFLAEAARALTPGREDRHGRAVDHPALVDPLPLLPPRGVPAGRDVARPFASDTKDALEGNAAIPYLALARLRDGGLPLHLVRARAPSWVCPTWRPSASRSRARCPSFSSAWRGRGGG